MDKQQMLFAILAETRRQYDAAYETLVYAAKEAVTNLQQQLADAQANRHQPPSASDEREAFMREFRHLPMADALAEGLAAFVDPKTQGAWEGWQARAALAPSPGVDAAEQKPVAEVVWIDAVLNSGMPAGKEIDCSMAWLDAAPIGTKLYAAPSPAASADTDKRFPYYELRFIMRVLGHKGSAPKEDWGTAYGMALKVFEHWAKNRNAAPQDAASADEWMAEAERMAKDLRNKAMAAGWGKTNDEPADDAYAALLAHLKAHP